MAEAPLELVFWKWRKTYRKKWGLKPPAKHLSSMVVENRSMDGERERVKVSVQTGKNTYESVTVVVLPEDWQRYSEVMEKLESPKANWESLDEGTQEAVMGAWRSFESWARGLDKVGRVELSSRLLKLFDMMKDRHRVNRPVALVLYIAITLRKVDQRDSEVFDEVAMMLIDMNATLDLFRECKFYQRRTRKEVLGYDGGARSIWEGKHELSSAESRWAFAKKRMKFYGFIS